jgi:hypothetical protein
MGLTLLTAASSTALVELAAVKSRLGISGSAQDATLQDLVREASASIVKYMGRDLARQGYHEGLQGLGKPYLLLSRFPVDRDSLVISINGLPAPWITVHDAAFGKLFSPGGWGGWSGTWDGYLGGCGGYWNSSSVAFGQDDLGVNAYYMAGYVVPGMLTTWPVPQWAASTEYSLGDWVKPLSGGSPLLMECTTAGTSGLTEPAWPVPQVIPGPGGAGATVKSFFTVADGSAVWTSRDAQELDPDIRKAAILTVKAAVDSAVRPFGQVSISGGDLRESYVPGSVDIDLPNGVKRLLDNWDAGRV